MSKIWNWLKGLFSKQDVVDLLDLGKKLAVPIVEALTQKDLDGDGVVAARAEVLAVAEQFGLSHLKKIAVMIADGQEMKRLLAIAQTAMAIANSLGADKVPQYRILELVVSAAFNFINE